MEGMYEIGTFWEHEEPLSEFANENSFTTCEGIRIMTFLYNIVFLGCGAKGCIFKNKIPRESSPFGDWQCSSGKRKALEKMTTAIWASSLLHFQSMSLVGVQHRRAHKKAWLA